VSGQCGTYWGKLRLTNKIFAFFSLIGIFSDGRGVANLDESQSAFPEYLAKSFSEIGD